MGTDKQIKKHKWIRNRICWDSDPKDIRKRRTERDVPSPKCKSTHFSLETSAFSTRNYKSKVSKTTQKTDQTKSDGMYSFTT